MHSSIQKQGVRSFVRNEAPALAIAFLITELFYTWGSFTLECAGFLATWYVLSLAFPLVSSVIIRNGDTAQKSGG
ncbi:MAG: hypothetical protein ACR2N5_02745 [Solirubrobacterales bacterium]